MKNFLNLKKGFSLIEILVVIAVVSILLTIGVYSYQQSITQARDQRRKADIAQLQSALENYKSNDLDGSYPNATYSGLCTVLVPNYLPKLPYDPAGVNPCVVAGSGNPSATYTYVPDCSTGICATYELTATLERTQEVYRVDPRGEVIIPTEEPTPTAGQCLNEGERCISNGECCSKVCGEKETCEAVKGGGGIDEGFGL